jgi:dihydroorotate dehydrogenase (fumarate)
MGMDLKHPIVAAASPLSGSVAGIKRLEDAGASAVVMFSLFEEQIRRENEALDYLMASGTESFAESISYFPQVEDYHVGPDSYLDIIRRASESVDIPIIGSLNGVTNEGWIDYAKQIQEAGAKGIELNIYYIPADLGLSGRDVEQRYLDIAKAVKSAVSVPVALKLSPFFSSISHMAKQFDDMGIDGLVLFNRFYQPDFNLAQLEVSSTLELSTASEIRLPLLWIAVLYGHIKASLAATRGVHSADEVVKYLLAGADAVMVASTLLQHGVGFIKTLVHELETWLASREYESIQQMKGIMSRQNVADPSAFERANYIKVLEGYKSPYLAP